MNRILEWFSKARSFISDTKAEWAKVTVPSRNEVVSTTIVVIITSVIFALYLWFADTVIYWAYQGVNTVIAKVGNVLS